MGKFITIIALLAVSVATFAMYVRPTYDRINEVKTKVARLDEALSKTRNIRRIRESLSSRFAEFSEENLGKLQKMLPDHVDNVRLVLDMDGIASQYGIRLKNVTVQKENSIKKNNQTDLVIGSGNAAEGPFQSLILQFDVDATYDEFNKFIKDLESSLRIVDVVELSMRPASGDNASSNIGGGTEPRYNFTIALKTYWLK